MDVVVRTTSWIVGRIIKCTIKGLANQGALHTVAFILIPSFMAGDTSCLMFWTHASSPPLARELLGEGTKPDSSLFSLIIKDSILHIVSF